ETLKRQMRRADARHLLGHDELFVERGAHSAILLRPVRRDPAFARERVIPGHQLRGRRTCCAAPKRERKIGFQPGPYFHAELGFGGGITTEHGEGSFRCWCGGKGPGRGPQDSLYLEVCGLLG